MTEETDRRREVAIRTVQSVLAPFEEMQRRQQHFLDAMASVSKTISVPSFSIPVFKVPELPRIEFTFPKMSIDSHIAPLLDIGRHIQDIWAPYVAQLSEDNRKRDALEAAGWLPHYTTPLHLLEASELSSLFEEIEAHYLNNWPSTKELFLSNVAQYGIDDEAKNVFGEAMQAHEFGLFRCVPRTLFPEIERVSRKELPQDPTRPITSQHKLRELAGNRYLDEFKPGGMLGMTLFQKLDDHIYANFEPADAAIFESDPTPNRHAALHGFASYASHQSSINALIMADFIFQVVHLSKLDNEESEEGPQSQGHL